MPELQCVLVTPEKTLVDTRADFVVLPLYDGELGVAPSHAPMIGRLGAGELRIRSGKQTTRFYVEGGFVEILDNVVSVLTGRALPAEQLDAAVAQEQLDAARGREAHSPELMAIRDRNVSASRAQLRVARRNTSPKP